MNPKERRILDPMRVDVTMFYQLLLRGFEIAIGCSLDFWWSRSCRVHLSFVWSMIFNSQLYSSKTWPSNGHSYQSSWTPTQNAKLPDDAKAGRLTHKMRRRWSETKNQFIDCQERFDDKYVNSLSIDSWIFIDFLTRKVIFFEYHERLRGFRMIWGRFWALQLQSK